MITAMSTTEEGAATSAAAVSSSSEEEKQNNGGNSSFLEAAAAAATNTEEPTTPPPESSPDDIENQQRPKFLATSDFSVGILAPHDDDASSTDSVFSFDSFEMKRRTPLKFQSMTNNNAMASSSNVPFPSVRATNDYSSSDAALAMTENICPCQCLFFTVKESICLVMSALGCAVFLAGLIVLCMYLEGSLFYGN
jgi:hypothetical protein